MDLCRCYFPLSWDVLIRFKLSKSREGVYTVISRYLGMFSLDSTASPEPRLLCVISRYLGMFSLDDVGIVSLVTEKCYFPLSWDVLIRSNSARWSNVILSLFPVILGCSH